MLTFREELGIYHLDIPPEVENHLSRVVPRICGALAKIVEKVEERKLFYFSASPWLGGLCNGKRERRGERLVFCKSIKMNRNELSFY